MRLYLDTEFNGFGGELISMALVSPDGQEWYEVRETKDPVVTWVRLNVIPKLGKPALRPLIFRSSFQQFITQFKNPEIICDWHTDAQHFCALLDGPSFGSSLDFECTLKILRTPPIGGPQPRNPHNALSDAEALMLWHTGEIV